MTTTGLQCPTCGHIHPLAEVAGRSRFRCAGCQKLLAAPEPVEAPAAEPTTSPAPPAGDGARGASRRTAAPTGGSGRAVTRLPVVVRVAVWVAAVALGFVVSAAVLRVVGLLDVDAVLDAFAGDGIGRYSLLLVLLPLWAVLSAGAAHLVLEWATRRRARRKAERRSAADPEKAGPKVEAERRRAG